jgi:hypothetical protein
VRLKVDISREKDLLFLVDTEADVGLVKGNKLIGTTECDPEKKVKVCGRIANGNTWNCKGENRTKKQFEST